MDFAVSIEPFRHISILRKKNIWYSVCDGNWSDPNTWISNALDRKLITSPRVGDDVYINHNVTCDGAYTVNNIYGNGDLIMSPGVASITVNGDIQFTGTVDQSGVGTSSFILNGYNNFIVNYLPGTMAIVVYNGLYNQPVMPLSYANLTISNKGVKYLTANTTIATNLIVNTNLECGTYNLTVSGTTTIPNTNIGVFSKSGAGSLLFVGLFDATLGSVDWSGGNPSIEFRGGLTMNSFAFKTGTGTISFTTNNQNISQGNSNTTIAAQFMAPISIVGAITLTNNGGAPFVVNNTINGTVAGSTFKNSATLYFSTTAAVPMATGVFNYMPTSASTMGYVMNANYTLPYTSYGGLYIGGSSVKTLGGNTTLSGNLRIDTNLNCSTSSLTVNGTTLVANQNVGSFTNTGGGAMLFVGNFDGASLFSTIDWSGGNPNVEFRGGMSVNCYNLNTGTGVFSFTTNNQNIQQGNSNPLFGTFACAVSIVGAITLTNNGAQALTITGTINGSSASSTFDNRGTVNYQNATAPMVAGKLFCNQATNTWIYGLAGNQDITVPQDATPGYKNLTLQTSGAKKLLGNVSVKATYTLTAPATLNSNGFSLTNP